MKLFRKLHKENFIGVFNKTIRNYIGEIETLCCISEFINVFKINDDKELLFIRDIDSNKLNKPLYELIHVIATNTDECNNFINSIKS